MWYTYIFVKTTCAHIFQSFLMNRWAPWFWWQKYHFYCCKVAKAESLEFDLQMQTDKAEKTKMERWNNTKCFTKVGKLTGDEGICILKDDIWGYGFLAAIITFHSTRGSSDFWSSNKEDIWELPSIQWVAVAFQTTYQQKNVDRYHPNSF